MSERSSADIAIVGMASVFPGATTTREYWLNVLRKIPAITEIPRDRWDWRLFFNDDRTSKDELYAKWGGFIPDVPFDPLTYGIPPSTVNSVEPAQLITLDVARQTLEDSGALERGLDKENTSVFIGYTMGMAEMGQRLAARSELAQLLHDVPPDVLERLPDWTETSFVGALQNVVAGRITNRFDFGGTNQVIDAACASSLASVAQGCQELVSGDANFVLAGGTDTHQGPYAYFSLARTQALSPTGRSIPFDKKADGIVIGEGVGMVALKRYEDAVRDDDRIYAVIKGWGSSSDGKAKSLFTPYPPGQKRALKRAYKRAGFSISTVGLIAAHGTGTVAGDNAEVAAIVETLQENNAAPKSVAVCSVKAQVGHLKGSAGIASLIESSLALHHKTLPPQMGVDQPLDIITDKDSPVYLIENPQPWVRRNDVPRRAGVSAFGFGGTNFHVVLEEVPDEQRKRVAADTEWSAELFLLKGDNREELIRQAEKLISDLDDGAEPRLCDLAYSMLKRAWNHKELPATLVIVARDLKHLRKSLDHALPHLRGEATWPLDNNIRITDELEAKGETVGFLFPGQGSQYVGQHAEMVSVMPELEAIINQVNQVLDGRHGNKYSDLIYPASLFTGNDDEILNKPFLNPRLSGLALACFQAGMIDLMRGMNLNVKFATGHSLGEPASYYYAGHYSLKDWVDFFDRRMERMHEFTLEHDTQLLAIGLDQVHALSLAYQYPTLNLANYNATNQTVVGGAMEDVIAFRKNPEHRDLQTYKIQLTGAYHCTQYHVLRPELREICKDIKIHLDTDVRTYNAQRGTVIDTSDDEELKDRFACHLTVPVDWVNTVRKMYDDGVRVFVELGPRSLLTNLCDNILIARKPYWAVSLDGEGGGLAGFLLGLGRLFGWGVDFNLPFIYDRRDVKLVDLDNLVETTKPAPLRPTTWFVNGGNARPMNKEIGHFGAQPLLNLETKQKKVPAKLMHTNGKSPEPQPMQEQAAQAPELNEPPTVPDFPPDADPQQVMAEFQARMQAYLERQEEAMRKYWSEVQRRSGEFYPGS